MRSVEGYYFTLKPLDTVEQGDVAGIVIHDDDDIFNVPIILDDEFMSKLVYETVVVSYVPDDDKYIIRIKEEFLENMRNDPQVFLPLMWIEIGHLHFEHYKKRLKKNPEEIITEREECIKNNRLNYEIIEADTFAVSKTSVNDVLDYIDSAIKYRNNKDELYIRYLQGRLSEICKSSVITDLIECSKILETINQVRSFNEVAIKELKKRKKEVKALE